MKKRLVSIILTVFLVLSMMPFAAFADNAIVCPACGGEVIKKPYHLVGNYWDFYKCNTCGKWAYLSGVAGLKLLSAGDQAIINAADANAILNFSFNNGHLIPAEKAPSGIGRKDLPGYADDNGKASISKTGMQAITLKPVFRYRTRTGNPLVESGEFSGLTFDGEKDATSSYSVQVSANRLDVKNTSDSSIYMGRFYVSYEYTFPDYGTVYFDTDDITWKVYGAAQITDGNLSDVRSWNSGFAYIDSTDKTNGYRSVEPNSYKFWKAFTVYDSGWDLSAGRTGRAVFSDAIIYFKAAKSPIINKTNITINNNTWNGNIYQDNSTNLTYIYPQYTTVNEKNETVTNISNTPIIYNNETKQYYTYDQTTKNYYYITYNAPSPSPTPAPTWTPGGGATRGGGVGRHPSDTDAADWTLHYYVLNNRRYDAYYALKKTEVDTDTKLPWVDNKKYISTTQIPIANGQYTVSVPDGVYWRVWSWDEASQTLTGVNSSNWHSTINNFLFNATGEYIFEFCKADGSDFDTAKDVTLKLKNDKITKYEDGGTIVEEPTPSPSPEPTETPSPTEPPTHTATPNPGGGTVPTPGGDSGGGNSGSSDSGWNPFKWLTDLLKDIVETILKGLWKLLTSIFGFILWLLSLLFKLFPWMPNSGILALCAGVVVVTVIRIIKFITGR